MIKQEKKEGMVSSLQVFESQSVDEMFEMSNMLCLLFELEIKKHWVRGRTFNNPLSRMVVKFSGTKEQIIAMNEFMKKEE